MRYGIPAGFQKREAKPEMKSITEQDLRSAFPDDLAYFDALTPVQRESYLALTTVYRRLLNSYVAFVGLGKYDIALAHNERAVVPVQVADQDLYQAFSGGALRYFYVRSNTYIERLTADELAFLRERVREGNLTLDLDSYHFVEDTFARVTRERWARKDGKGDASWTFADAEVNFGPNEDRFFCPNGALVVGCRVAERQTHEALEDVLHCCDLLERSLRARLTVPLSVVLYDAASVRPLG